MLALKLSEPRSNVSEILSTFFLYALFIDLLVLLPRKQWTLYLCQRVYLLHTDYINAHSTNKVRTFGWFPQFQRPV